MRLRKYLGLALGVVVALSPIVMNPISAEDDKAAAKQQQPQLPVSAEQALYLIRSTLLTLNDANRSGNYSVLRDLAAPDFQARNSAADLALGFTDLRRRNFDLFSVALAAPQLSTPPYLDPNKMLRLTGFFPTRPLQINFDLTFQNVGNQWRPYGISVATPQAPPETAAAPAPAPAKKNASQKN
ncbi:hypothetical protein ACVI1J_000557 [Bradyrhizobium diazoefficiens]|uniref:hypothetical protein n=1 Tax=Bradyrhizobium diazoefficiens TaxID=1355477 RepID=UPI001FE1E6AC|nr:hypothetical protein [Bradyrhizobium diazoefficiens]